MNFTRDFAHLIMVVLAGLVVAVAVCVFLWAGVPTMTMCLGTMPMWVTGLLILSCVYVLPYIFKRKSGGK